MPEKCNNKFLNITNLESIIKELSDKYCYKSKSYLGVYKIDKKCSAEKMLKIIDEFHKKLKSKNK